MLELTIELRENLKTFINQGFLSFEGDNGEVYQIPMTQERKEICLQAIITGWWDFEKLLTT